MPIEIVCIKLLPWKYKLISESKVFFTSSSIMPADCGPKYYRICFVTKKVKAGMLFNVHVLQNNRQWYWVLY